MLRYVASGSRRGVSSEASYAQSTGGGCCPAVGSTLSAKIPEKCDLCTTPYTNEEASPGPLLTFMYRVGLFVLQHEQVRRCWLYGSWLYFQTK